MTGMAGLFFFSLTSCDKALNDLSVAAQREKLTGTWLVEENSQTYKKSLKAVNHYTSTISASTSNLSNVAISNFYGLGESTLATATLNNMKLTIDNQTVSGGYTISGNGSIASDFKTIDWQYTVDDGSGVKDKVTATFTKQ